jgi:hypothetical protein
MTMSPAIFFRTKSKHNNKAGSWLQST